MLRKERGHGADGADRPVAVVAGRAEPRPAADQRNSRELGQLLDLRFISGKSLLLLVIQSFGRAVFSVLAGEKRDRGGNRQFSLIIYAVPRRA